MVAAAPAKTSQCVYFVCDLLYFLPLFHCNRNTRNRRRQWRRGRERAIESQPLNKFGINCGPKPQIKSMLIHFNFNFQICLFAMCRGELRIQIHKIIFTATSQTGSTYVYIPCTVPAKCMTTTRIWRARARLKVFSIDNVRGLMFYKSTHKILV